MTDLALRCTGAEVTYTIRSHRPLIRDLLRGSVARGNRSVRMRPMLETTERAPSLMTRWE